MKPLLLSLLAACLMAAPAAAQDEHPIAKAVAAQLTNPKKKFTLLVEVKTKPGEAAKLIAAFAEVIEAVRKEEGCSRYELNQDAADPSVFVMYERWASLEKLKAHLAQPHTRALLEKIHPLLDGEPKLRVLLPQADPQKPKPAAK